MIEWVNHNYPALMVVGSLAVQLATLIIMGYQHRLMWRDYRRRHKINGDGPH